MASELFEKRLALTRQLLAVGYGRVYLSELTISELEDLIKQDPEEILREEDLKAELEIIEQKRGNGREPFIQLDWKETRQESFHSAGTRKSKGAPAVFYFKMT